MIQKDAEGAGLVASALFSDCMTYRYRLSRVWDRSRPALVCVLLNPSTATESRADPTLDRCLRRARILGFGGCEMVNLFAFRATDPAEMCRAADPVGPENDAQILAAAMGAGMVLCGWGTHGAHLGRGAQVQALLRDAGLGLWHLGLTRGGAPRHPLYVGYGTAPQPWPATDARR